MTIEIIQCDADSIRPLAKLYNEAIRGIPHCYPVDVRRFEHAVGHALNGVPDPYRSAETVLAVAEAGEIVGFAHPAIGKVGFADDEEAAREPDAGLLRFFWYRPGHRQAGVALLDAAEAYCRGRGMTQITAYATRHNEWFYHMGSACMSDRLGHVGALLGLRGYAPVNGEVFMAWRDFAVPALGSDAFPVTYTVETVPKDGIRPGVTVRAFLDGERIGVCVATSAAERTHARPAQDWIFTDWLGVDDAYQGQGLGRSLLQRSLLEARKLGYRHAVISTWWQNYRAYTFYTNFGYHVSDWTYALARDLT